MASLLKLCVISTEVCKGEGTDASPNRSVEQWWSPDGILLLEYDPHLDKTSMTMNLVEFLRDQKASD